MCQDLVLHMGTQDFFFLNTIVLFWNVLCLTEYLRLQIKSFCISCHIGCMLLRQLMSMR